MDTITEVYIFASAMFIACWFARHVPVWVERAYKKDVARNGYRHNFLQEVYEILCEEGA